MKNKTISVIKYAGSKRKFVEIINAELSKINNPEIYIEPFLGSGAVFLNLPENFKHSKKYLFEINENICKIWFALKNAKYYDFEKFWDENEKKFGKWGSDKQAFYAMRNFNNEKLFNSNSLEEGIFYFIIGRSCINGLLRWGKKGFNSAFGNRGRSLNFNQAEFNFIQNKLLNANIKCDNFFNIYDNFINNENAVWFLDPPYISSNMEESYICNFDQIKFLNILKNIKGKVIYTDMLQNHIKDFLNWRIVELQNLTSISPHDNRGIKRGKEVMYINF